MNLWIVGCCACSDGDCYAIFDHNPSMSELREVLCDLVVDVRPPYLKVIQCKLHNMINTSLGDVVWG